MTQKYYSIISLKIKKTDEFDSDGCCYPKGANEATKKDPKE